MWGGGGGISIPQRAAQEEGMGLGPILCATSVTSRWARLRNSLRFGTPHGDQGGAVFKICGESGLPFKAEEQKGPSLCGNWFKEGPFPFLLFLSLLAAPNPLPSPLAPLPGCRAGLCLFCSNIFLFSAAIMCQPPFLCQKEIHK